MHSVTGRVRRCDQHGCRSAEAAAAPTHKPLERALPPRKPGEAPWGAKDYDNPRRARARELFA